MRLLTIFVAASVMASCSPLAPDPYTDQLVERFDVDLCSDVQLKRAGRHPDKSRSGTLGVYIADADCVASMREAFEIIAFRQVGEATYRYTSDRGWAEVVTLTPLDDGSGTRIDWETFES